MITKIDKIKNKIEKLHKELEKESAEQTLACDACKKETKIKNITILDKQYYVRPRGCMEGDYWTTSEYQTVCPHCNKRTRYTDNEDKEFMLRHISLFRTWLEWHDEPDNNKLIATLEDKKQKRIAEYDDWY